MRSQLRLLAAAVILLPSLNLPGQGSGVVNYNLGNVPPEQRIWVASSLFDPNRTLAGSGYQTALYWGVAGETDDRNLVQVGGPVGFLTGSAAGTFFGSGRTI